MTHQQPPSPDERQLEQFVGSILRRQPLRQAPATLETRVLRELALAARPWWQRGFSRWPLAARVVCMPLGVGLAWLSLLTTARLVSLWQSIQHSAPASTAQAGLQWFQDLGLALQALGHVVTREIPQWWVYGGAGLAIFVYAALFGLSAAAFRTLLVTSTPARYPS